MTRTFVAVGVLVATFGLANRAQAQPLGTFTWQLQPFCNVVTVNLTQQGAVYTMDGFDDQCRRGPTRAARGASHAERRRLDRRGTQHRDRAGGARCASGRPLLVAQRQRHLE